MGLFSSSSKQTQNVTEITSGANVAGDTTAPVLSLAQSSGNTFNMLDGGAVSGAFDFADSQSEKSYGLANEALDQAGRAFSTTRDALQNAYTDSLNLVSASREPADEKTRQQSVYLALGALALVAVIIYVGKS